MRASRGLFPRGRATRAIAFSLLCTGADGGAAPDPDLAGRVLARLQRDRAEIEHYTYVETAVLEKRTTDGSIRSRTSEVHEVFMQDGRTMKRPLFRDVAQDSEGFSLVRGEETRFLQDLNSRDGRARPAQESLFNLENLVHCFYLDAVGHDRLGDREVLKVEFTPIEGCLNQNTRAMKIAAALSGFLWLDGESDVVSVEGHLVQPVSFGFGILGKVETFDLQADREPISPDAYIMTRFEYRARGTALLFHRFDVLSTRYRSAFARRPAAAPEPGGSLPSASLDPKGQEADPNPRR